jgi:disulfide bond formation protein DsbB
MLRSAKPASLLLLIALACILMLAGALFAQHVLGWEPCTLCVQIRLWLSMTAIFALMIRAASAVRQGWLQLVLWPLLLASSGMALIDNVHVSLIEQGIMQSFSCSPFPFYYRTLALHEYLPAVFMSGGICGQNDFRLLGLPFSLWTLVSIALLFALILATLWRCVRDKT